MKQSRFADLASLLGAALLCAAAGVGASLFSDLAQNEIISLWQPLTGLALALLILGGPRYLWPVLTGFLVSTGLSHGLSTTTLALTLGGAAGPLAGAWLLRDASTFDNRLARLHDYTRLMAYGGLLACAVSALLGSALLLLVGVIAADEVPRTALHWWMGGLLSVALVTPLLLVWQDWQQLRQIRSRAWETLLVIGLTFLNGQMVFLDWFVDAENRGPRGYSLMLFVVWAALRLGRRGVTLVLLLTATQALTGTLMGLGFFAADGEGVHFLSLWVYLMVLAVSGMTLASVAKGQRHKTRELARNTASLREAAVLELQRSQEQLSLALKGSKDGLWDWDAASDTVDRSPSWYQMLGYDMNGVASNRAHIYKLMHPDDVTQAHAEMDKQLASGQDHYVNEYRLQHKQGHYISVLTRGYIQRNLAGKVMRITGTTSNLTEQKEREAKLNLAAVVFQQSREGITMTDAQSNIILVNQAFTRITGYSESEVLGKNPRLLASGRHSHAFYQAMWQTLERNDFWAGEIWNQRKDGSVFPMWLTISIMRDPQEKVSHYLANFTDLSDTKAAEKRIQWLSYFDPLTLLPNRALLKDRTKLSLAMAVRAGEPLTMMLLSIDQFKSVNDTLGHDYGDQLLVAMAKRLSTAVRAQDTVARTSGKEFVLVLPGTSSLGAEQLAADLLLKLSRPYNLGEQALTVSTSIGIASYPAHGSHFNELFKAVEIAMHAAETQGRDLYQVYSEAMYLQVIARDNLNKALSLATARDQLHLVYQPLVDLPTGRISGMEALLRWRHPELGPISPAVFIPLAEESALIMEIGEWVLRRVCADMRCWLDQGIAVPPVAINVSPLQFRDANLVTLVEQAMTASQIDPALIFLEITEGALMTDVRRSEAMLKELKTLGLKLSLDDFGTGYSSLSYLKRFPFDKVKIDQSFIRDISHNLSDRVIANVIISMAHGLGLKVIAEGVETEAQCAFLRAQGCNEIQGYLFSKPISFQAMEEMLTENRQLEMHCQP